MTYPFGALPDNLVAFSAFLRREHGFGIGPGEVYDAARALAMVGVADERVVRDVLRPLLSRSREDVEVFDAAFSAFFFPGPSGVPQAEQPPASSRAASDNSPEHAPTKARARGRTDEGGSEDHVRDAAIRPASPTATDDSESDPRMPLARARYSPFDVDVPAAPSEISHLDPAWRDAARLLVRRVQLGLARRWRPAARGQRFDLRRTMRASLRAGGETLFVRWLRRPKRSPRFVLLVDGSRSMGDAASAILKLSAAVVSVTLHAEVFTFSTRLERVTDHLRRAVTGESVRVEHLQNAWGSGTTIGICLREFLQRFGDRLLGRETLVIIASDGLDVGEREVLRDAMKTIRRRSAGIVWVNPLIETAGYEPTAFGMMAARPYITTFAAAGDPAAFARLARSLRVRS